MPELVLSILKYLFLILLFIFLARAVRAMYLEIYGTRNARRRETTDAPRTKAQRPPDRVAVASSNGKPRVYTLEEELLIGRGEKCHVVINDVYASQVHARIFKRDDAYFIEDMGSTNGTFLNRKKVTAALPVNRGDRVRIGKTEIEFKR